MTTTKLSKDLVQQFAKMPENYLLCRDWSHAYVQRHDHGIVRNTRGTIIQFKRVLQCTRCQLEMTQTVDARTFDIISTTRAYPDGYLFKNTHGERPRKADARRESFRRVRSREQIKKDNANKNGKGE